MEKTFVRNRTQTANQCPCGKSNKDGKFAPSKDDPENGYCHSCNKWFNNDKKEAHQHEVEKVVPISYHPFDFVKKSAKNDNNNFVKFLNSKFDSNKVNEVIKTYSIGRSKHWNGATIFWQIDLLSRVRYGKVMLYDAVTGKRVKKPFNHFTNIHTLLKLKDFNYKQCLFGLHLLSANKKPIAVVESEKTAVIMSLVDDSYLWLATGGKGNFKYDILEPLAGKKVIAFPDTGETLWNEIANRLNDTGFNIEVSDVLEGEGYPTGFDLADVVLQQMENNQKELSNTVKNGIAENQSITNLERIRPNLIIPESELVQLAKQMIPEYDNKTQEFLLNFLNHNNGLTAQEGKDLLLTMQIRQVIELTSLGTYFLSSSTPY